MLRQSLRFHGRGVLRRLYTATRPVRSRRFIMRYQFLPHRRSPRAAVVVSKKISKRAVERNRIRRRVYEILRAILEERHDGLDLVFIVTTADVGVISHQELAAEIQQLYEQIEKPT